MEHEIHDKAEPKKEAKKSGCLQPSPKILVSCRGLNGELLKWMGAVCGVEI